MSIETFFGINPKTFEVESVSRTRGGTLSRWNENGVYSHNIEHGRNAQAEVAIVFGLREIFSVPELLVNSENTKQRVEELRKKAAEMKRVTEEAAAKRETSEAAQMLPVLIFACGGHRFHIHTRKSRLDISRRSLPSPREDEAAVVIGQAGV